jgi:hypothetical protein
LMSTFFMQARFNHGQNFDFEIFDSKFHNRSTPESE